MSNVTWRSGDEPVSRQFIEEIANKIGVVFPEDYIVCVMENNGARVSPEIFNVGEKERVFGMLLTFDQDDNESLYNIYKGYQDTLPDFIIPFAIDPAGNLICFDYKNHEKNPIVVFWEHEDAWEKEILMKEEGLSEEEAEEAARENIFYVANTFTEFLQKLYEDEED
ncbi:SMI1/KNR4 family protein [Bacillus sp. JZ8]